MEFKEAVDRIGLPVSDVAAEFGVKPQSLRQMMLSSDKASYRRPHAGWELVLAEVARKRARELLTIADELAARGADR